MVAVWPETLPPFLLLDGASEGAGDAILEYAPDTGPSITRRRTTAAARPLSGSMMMRGDQLAIFREFIKDDISQCSLPFEFPDQTSEGTMLVKFPKDGLPRWAPAGGDNWRVSFSLIILP